MSRSILTAFVAVLGLIAASGAMALLPSGESPAPPARSSAASPISQGQSAPNSYRSAFERYRPFREDQAGWREANEEVERIGGWKAYAKEAHQTNDASAAGDEKAVPPDPHAGHH